MNETKPVSARPLDAMAAVTAVILCLSWGITHVAIKYVMPEVPAFTQGFVRSGGGAIVVLIWTLLRGVPLFNRDGSLRAGLAVGFLFGIEFLLLFWGLSYTTAARAVLLLYSAPFFVVLGSRWFLPAERVSRLQFAGVGLSFAGVALALGAPTPAPDPMQFVGDLMILGAAFGWGVTTLMIKSSALATTSFEKTTLYQLGMGGLMAGAAALIAGETLPATPSALSIGFLVYQAVWGGGLSFAIWFGLVVRYSASRLSSFTFITPVFGVACGHFILGDPLTPTFLAAVALVALGIVLVNRQA